MVTPHVVLISGSLRPGSTSDRIAQWCAERCTEQSATARVFTGGELDFPFYRPGVSDSHEGVREFLGELARADGVVLISPTYHGTLSGLLKNALDYTNDLGGPRPFLDGRTIGCVAVGAGTQGTVSTLGTLRDIAHALRGWPTPLGVVVPHAGVLVSEDSVAERHHREKLTEMVCQVLSSTLVRTGELPASVGVGVGA
ncbi:NAD(P)H-dependent oxidoreductase [Streptomyces sp. SB3404]|uniref:NAD(P)H-dependent oxidoreductase n=1 Tax=Streptomyces boncukensis TaxID=2711219 RepID=A0A6G4WRQ6_9ACTN|nr:NAD(P)H-dependent oxidoreductase [Streptomyces boncukensis]